MKYTIPALGADKEVSVTITLDNDTKEVITPVTKFLMLLRCKTSKDIINGCKNILTSPAITVNNAVQGKARVTLTEEKAVIPFNGREVYTIVFKYETLDLTLQTIVPLGYTITKENYNKSKNISKIIDFVLNNQMVQQYEEEAEFVKFKDNSIKDALPIVIKNAKAGEYYYLTNIAD